MKIHIIQYSNLTIVCDLLVNYILYLKIKLMNFEYVINKI